MPWRRFTLHYLTSNVTCESEAARKSKFKIKFGLINLQSTGRVHAHFTKKRLPLHLGSFSRPEYLPTDKKYVAEKYIIEGDIRNERLLISPETTCSIVLKFRALNNVLKE